MPRAEIDHFNYVLGTQTIGVKYQFTDKTTLIETAEEIFDMGSNILKILMSKHYCGEHYGLPKQDFIHSLADLARQEPSYKAILGMPFAYYLIWTYPLAHPDTMLFDQLTEEMLKAEYDEMFAFTRYLLQTYSGSGKTFLLGHWEGDWHLLPTQDPGHTPTPEAIQGMIKWLNVRQKAIDDAKGKTKHQGVRVYHYAEVNLVQKALKGEKCLTNDVLPHTPVDFVSYSCYDTIFPPRDNIRAELHKALDHIESKLPAKNGISGRRVFIGEYGFPLQMTRTPERQEVLSRAVARAALEWGCPYILYWQMYCNEKQAGRHRGVWLIDDKGNKQPVYHMHRRFYAQAKQYVVTFREKYSRIPTDAEFREKAVGFLTSSGK